MPLWAWVLVVLAVVLAVMWVWDRRTKARGARLADSSAMARGVRSPEGTAEAHRAGREAMQWDRGASGW